MLDLPLHAWARGQLKIAKEVKFRLQYPLGMIIWSPIHLIASEGHGRHVVEIVSPSNSKNEYEFSHRLHVF